MISDSLRRSWLVSLLLIAFLVGCTGAGEVGPSVQAAGQPESSNTRLLAAGSTLLQRDVPPGALNIYLVGFHPLKDNPSQQMEAHHFCHQVNKDFMQCALFDGNTPDAELIQRRDQRMGIDTEERRRDRQDLTSLAHPQEGVDALKGAFGNPTQPIPGVVDTRAAR